MNITEPLRRHALLTPDAPALILPNGTAIGFGALDRAIDAVAGHARRLGLGAGDMAELSVTGPDEALGLITLLGLARLGVATTETPLPDGLGRLRFAAGGAAPPGCVAVDAGWLHPDPRAAEAPPVARDDGATLRIFASSGTTGLPKQVIVTHAQMTQRVLLRLLADGGAPAVRIIGVGLGCAWGLETALRTLWAGGTIVLTNPRDAPAAILRHGVTAMLLTPASLRLLLDSMPADAGPFPALRSVQVGGSLLPPALYRLALERLSPHMHSVMGSTEAAGFVSAPMRDLADRPGAVGYIWPGVEVEALDEHGRKLPAGETGVLRIRSPMNATGYVEAAGAGFADAAASGEDRFQDGWFHSSDIGSVGPDGMLTLTGRTTDVINAGGVKIHPHIIESVLLKLPTVLDAAAFGVPDPATGVVQVHAAIVSRTVIEEPVLRDLCTRVLGTAVLSGILQVKALPRNENGKVKREQLVDLALYQRAHLADAG